MGLGGPSNTHDAPNTGNGGAGPSNQNGNGLANTHSQAQGLAFGGSPFDYHSSGMDGMNMGSEAGPSSHPFGITHARRDSQSGSLSMIPELGHNSDSQHQSGRSVSSRGRTRKADAGKAAKRKSTGSYKAATQDGNGNGHGNMGNGMDIDTDPASLQAHAQALWAQSNAQTQNGIISDGQEGLEYPPSGGFGVPIGMLQQASCIVHPANGWHFADRAAGRLSHAIAHAL
jgi:hypothetical protein